MGKRTGDGVHRGIWHRGPMTARQAWCAVLAPVVWLLAVAGGGAADAANWGFLAGLGGVCAAAAMGLSLSLLSRRSGAFLATMTAMVAGTSVAVLELVPRLWLRLFGRRISAVVVDRATRRSCNRHHHCSTHLYVSLRAVGGGRLPGKVVLDGDPARPFVGAHLTVVHDALGIVDPRLPSQTHDVWLTASAVVVGVCFAIVAVPLVLSLFDGFGTLLRRRPAERASVPTALLLLLLTVVVPVALVVLALRYDRRLVTLLPLPWALCWIAAAVVGLRVPGGAGDPHGAEPAEDGIEPAY